MKKFVGWVAVLFLVPIRVPAVEINKDGWLFPNPALAEKKAIRPIDATDRIPGKETLVKIYQRKKDGVIFDIFEIEGEIYACQFHAKGENGKPPSVYAIVDTDGDGIFESKYAPGEKAHPPDWAIQRYYKKHPDLKDPGPSPSEPSLTK